MLLDEIASTSAAVAASSARLAKVERLATCLRRLEPGEVRPAVAFLSGELRQRQIGVGWAALRDAPDPAAAPTLTVAEVDAAFERIGRLAGPGSQAERRRLVGELFGRATAAEQRFLVGLLSGELRQGALEGVMVEAIAKAAGVAGAEVRRALMLRGAVGPVAEAALARGVPGLREFHLQVGRPLQPMLASTAPSIEAAIERLGEAAVEWKLDGVRVQLHKDGDEVRVFTRTLDDVTARVPEVVEIVTALPVRSAVLDGELIALRPDGRPQPFQVTAGRLGSRLDVERQRLAVPLTLYLFDVLHLDGEDLIDRAGAERHALLAAMTPEALRVPRTVTGDPPAAAGFLGDALARGHEGVLVKSLAAPYEAGRRGAGWLKVKPVHTLDLVVLAVEWGHGRRKGWLSNLHLGARDPETGGFVMLGKTFKGLTDKLLAWQTERLLELAVGPTDQWVVRVRPELVVEVAFDGVQASPRYPGGVALRFARVVRYRPDKRAIDADSIGAVQAIHAGAPPGVPGQAS
ncbi:MAG TPA: ATP-dependent DNA ligase [Actinomycetota bacterium]|nr:ATP-dependent DNA ligase [Actinomycetota bacterium]